MQWFNESICTPCVQIRKIDMIQAVKYIFSIKDKYGLETEFWCGIQIIHSSALCIEHAENRCHA